MNPLEDEEHCPGDSYRKVILVANPTYFSLTRNIGVSVRGGSDDQKCLTIVMPQSNFTPK
ncbi:hypothetical protein E2C01_051955 [Portunus trituberculatus]|uniref:Uncharacterized protein n=1 Tax=Portunus trituberculatus TaxID=210409 RepID=A0A5B7GKF5_PORTR|nr:hypothetical protein [Portunus trituberculatus]